MCQCKYSISLFHLFPSLTFVHTIPHIKINFLSFVELCNRVFASDVNEFKCKKSFLLSCSLHCHEIVNILVQYTSRVDRRTHQLR